MRENPRAGTVVAAVGLAVAAALLASRPASAQEIGGLVSPGPLSRAHSHLEGLKNCEKCHEPGKKVTAARCLACHQPIAERIAAHKGVHRDVTDDCVSCHVEHAGLDTELRPLDAKAFDHARETGFRLDGKHALIARDCAKCHKTRSYLGLKVECASCHQDPHNGALGTECARCHATAVAFKDSEKAFDHSKTAFALTAAHADVACAKCHVKKAYRGLKFALCTDCHADPHRQAFGAACVDCHSGPSWKTEKVDHARTAFALAGRHATVACAACHRQPAMRAKLAFDRCAACHTDPHKGEFKQDCVACHTAESFRNAPFDHGAKTGFALTGRHAALPCSACHKAAATAGADRSSELAPELREGRRRHAGLQLASLGGQAPRGTPAAVDFRGLSRACASCHADPHRGKLGAACESCHGDETFRVEKFTHPRNAELYGGQHATVACGKCHGGEGVTKSGFTGKPVGERVFRDLSSACASCHRDVHLGQLGRDCQTCHSVSAPKFAADRFDHATTAFRLTGRHEKAECAKCHARESGGFPAGSGVAVRFKGVGSACASCHKDVHLGQLGRDCQSCHGTSTFQLAGYTHRRTPELFVGKHAAAECKSCHKPGEGDFPAGHGTAVRYAVLSDACASCHEDPHRGALGSRCESCHTPARWDNASRAFHKATKFPLEGRHLAVPCASCHLNGVLAGTPTNCVDCHWTRRQDDRFRTRLGTECENCHRPTAWTAVIWDHATATGFPLNAAHRTLACESCHRDGTFVAGTPLDCYGCHGQVFATAASPNHVKAGFPTACDTCHKASDTSWQQGTFDHGFYPLVGVHATQTCAACHGDGVYAGKSTACVACHQTDFNNSKSPNHVAAGFPTTCDLCHKVSDANWQLGAFDHSTTQFPLLGAHATQACKACHGDNVFKGKPTACVSCHQTDFNNSKNPNHAAAGFSTACDGCHKVSDANWQLGVFNHATTQFPLAGAHATQTCRACHGDNVFKGKSTACVGCHQTDFNNSKNPPHLAAGFPTACDLCHKVSDTSWSQAVFDHSKTQFPLVGVHATQACKACHGDGVFKGKPTACVSCHQPDYDKSTNPNHVAAGFATACEGCHKVSDANWQFGVFNHATTQFPLAGVHATQTCKACHGDNVFKGKPTTCVSCHQADYNKSANPNHAAAGFATACDGCHKVSDATWQLGTFNHATTLFPLLGVHATQACKACHGDNVFKGKPTACVSCHQTDFNNSKSPNHAAAGFPTTCDTCHKVSDASWQLGAFDHATTQFPLVGVHATQTCKACHGDGVFKGKPTACVACHQADYDKSSNPSHAAAGFATACESCHKVSDATWLLASFNHGATQFPLLGVHSLQTCKSCHGDNVFKGKSTACVACHQADFNKSTNPSHAAAGFATACETCHKVSDSSWRQGTFNHSTTLFPLLGVHATQACKACHGDNVFKGKSTACVGCHQTDFNNSKSPNHVAAGFPTACDTCHRVSDANWQLGAFDHSTTLFPLLGVHATQSCKACHGDNVFKGKSTACVGCHQTDFDNSKSPNHAAAGFPTTCDTCHKVSDASWQLGVFNHAATQFPLVGAHATQSCKACHGDNVFKGKSTACVTCHQTDFNNSKSPNHVAAGFPTTCDLCHKVSDTAWTQATFNHAAVFPLAGVHATTACANCHVNNNYSTVPTTCFGCHQSTFQTASTPVNHAGLPTACDSCHGFTDPAWTAATTFKHANYFPLAGAHVAAACASCHKAGNFTTVPTTPCYACHTTDYQNATSPVNHVAGGFPTTCDTCHKFSDATWALATFDHSSVFPLAGVHATTACASCHVNNNYSTVPTTCYGCHQSTYQSATTPVAHNGMPTTCDTCHGFSDPAWTAATTFNHATYFPLAGAHVTTACANCHKAGNYITVPTSPCYACHTTDYQNAASPVNHAGFPTTCDTCHKFSDATWAQATFNHASVFPLAGVHATTACASCHTNNNYQTVPTTCFGCHQAVYQTATTPVNHAGLPTTCDGCHAFTDPAWTSATLFNHSAYFPLAGAHVTTACTNCHKAGNFTTVPTTPCYACHATDYQNATTPVNHIAAGFPTSCDTCHKFSDTSWTQAVFNHTWFPQNHGNSGGVCSACHTNPTNYAVFSCTTGCHPQSQTDPDHRGISGYVYNSTACYSCHPRGSGG